MVYPVVALIIGLILLALVWYWATGVESRLNPNQNPRNPYGDVCQYTPLRPRPYDCKP